MTLFANVLIPVDYSDPAAAALYGDEVVGVVSVSDILDEYVRAARSARQAAGSTPDHALV